MLHEVSGTCQHGVPKTDTGGVYEELLEEREKFLQLDIRDFYTFDDLEKESMGLTGFSQEDESENADDDEEIYDEEKAFETYKEELKQQLLDRMRLFDKEMEVLRSAVEAQANNFLAGVEKRYEGFDPFLRIHLRYSPPGEVYTEDGNEDEGEIPMLDIPAPRLEIGATFRERPFSEPGIILNEARMTALALVFYLAALKRVVPESSQAPKLLVLDDVLIGLDMAHRRPVLELLKREFRKWQVILLTFDRAWYEVGTQQLDSKGWKWYEAYAVRVGSYEQPVVGEDDDHLLRALAHLYPSTGKGLPDPKAAAVHVRSQFEKVLRKACEDRGVLLPFKSNPRYVTANEMWGGIQSLTYEIEQKPKRTVDSDGVVRFIPKKSKTKPVVPEKLQLRVSHALSWVLNPLSHSQSIDRYRAEIEDAIFAIEELETVLSQVTPPISAARKELVQELLKALQKKQEATEQGSAGVQEQETEEGATETPDA